MGELADEIHHEHEAFASKIESIRTVADAVGEVAPPILARMVDEVHSFLVDSLLPHAGNEDRVLYPLVVDILGTPFATSAMACDHREIERLTDALGVLRVAMNADDASESVLHALRETLYGLYAILKLHMDKEEQIYCHLLDTRLTDRGTRRALEALRPVELGSLSSSV